VAAGALGGALAAAGALGGALAAAPARATGFTLVDENSVVQLDTTEGNGCVYAWVVDGIDQLACETFFYRVGSDPEAEIATLTVDVEGTSDADFDGDDDTLFVRYLGTGFEIEVRLALTGGPDGSGISDLGEQISITNTTDSVLDFHFFEYADFILTGDGGSDTVSFPNAHTVRETAGLVILETVVTPAPSHHQASPWPALPNLLSDLDADDLDDTPAIGGSIGPGDIIWALQWDFAIAPGDTAQVSKDKRIEVIPEPETAALLLLGLGGLVALGGRRRARA
jgi:hypothetical protein